MFPTVQLYNVSAHEKKKRLIKRVYLARCVRNVKKINVNARVRFVWNFTREFTARGEKKRKNTTIFLRDSGHPSCSQITFLIFNLFFFFFFLFSFLRNFFEATFALPHYTLLLYFLNRQRNARDNAFFCFF